MLDALERCKRCESLLDGPLDSFSELRDVIEALDDLRKRLSARLGDVVRLPDVGVMGSSSPAKTGGWIISWVLVSVRKKVNSGVWGVIGGRDVSAPSPECFSFFLRRSLSVMVITLDGYGG